MALRIQAKRRLIALSAGLVSGLVCAGLAFAHWRPLERLDLLAYDELAQFAEDPGQADKQVLLVQIDDESLAWASRELSASWPWPREFYGVMAKSLRSWGARVVGFDLVFAQSQGDGWSDLEYFRDDLKQAGHVVLAASLSRGTPTPPPKVDHGVRLGHFATAAEARDKAVVLVSFGHRAYVAPAQAGGFDVWAGGYDTADGAAGAIARIGAALQPVAPKLVPDASAALDRPAFVKALTARLVPRAGTVPGGARPVTGAALLKDRFALGAYSAADLARQRLPVADVGTLPAALFLGAAGGVGIVDETPDPDGVLRRFRPFTDFQGALYPSLPLAMALAGDPGHPRAQVVPGLASVGRFHLPVDAGGAVGIRFHGVHPYGGGMGDGVPAWRILHDAALAQEGKAGTLDHGLFKGRYVLVGPKAAGLLDHKPSPVSGDHLGDDINAAALDGILTGRYVRRIPDWLAAILSLLVALASVIAAMAASTRFTPTTRGTFGEVLRLFARALLTGGAAILGFAPVLGLAWLLYAHAGWWTGLALPGVAAFGGVSLNYVVSEFLERRDRRAIHEALGIYTSTLVADLVASGGVHALDPRRDEVTVFFSDIQGFTSFSENMDPERLATLLGYYLTEMTDEVLAHEGIVDKYIGDAVMAFWGWRETQPDHALRAVRCALEMQARLARIGPAILRDYDVQLVTRMGINSGAAVVGNLGSAQKMNVTLMGDTVNLASRLEGANKAYDTRVMIGEETWRRLDGAFAVRELDLLRVKGKAKPVRVFEPVCERGALGDDDRAFLAAWEAALARYRDADFASARAAFETLRDADARTTGPLRSTSSAARPSSPRPRPRTGTGSSS